MNTYMNLNRNVGIDYRSWILRPVEKPSYVVCQEHDRYSPSVEELNILQKGYDVC